MGDWSMQGQNGAHADFLARYATKSRTPRHRTSTENKPVMLFTPSPEKFKMTNGHLENVTIRGEFKTPMSSGIKMHNGSWDPGFCRKDNVEECVSYLNDEVTVLGFPSLYHDTKGTFDIVRLVNCTYELLQLHQKSMRIKEQLENRQHRVESDLNLLQSVQTRLKDSLEKCQNDLAQHEEKERQLILKNKILNKKLKAEKEEVKRLQSNLHHRDTQYKHEVKKKEREMNRLKERLNQMLTNKSTERRIGMDILNSIQRSDGKRSSWKKAGSSKHEEEMYRLIISNYDDKQKELMVENSQLRQSLNDVQKELIALINGQPSPSKQDTQLDTSLESDEDDTASMATTTQSGISELSDGHFQMPYDMVKDGIEKSLKEKWKILRERVRKMQKGQDSMNDSAKNDSKNNSKNDSVFHEKETQDEYDKEIERLKEQAERYKQIVEQQEHLLQAMQDSVPGESYIHESGMLEEREALSEEKRLFYQQRANFEEERRNFTEAAIRLGRERKVFEEEKAKALQQQFLDMSPFIDGKGGRKSANVSHSYLPDHTKMTPSSPVFSPAPKQNSAPTPTTLDLYRTIGLTREDSRGPHSTTSSRHSKDSPGVLSRSNASLNSSRGSRGTSSGSTLRGSQDRLAEHAENVKMALFQKTGSNSSLTGKQNRDRP